VDAYGRSDNRSVLPAVVDHHNITIRKDCCGRRCRRVLVVVALLPARERSKVNFSSFAHSKLCRCICPQCKPRDGDTRSRVVSSETRRLEDNKKIRFWGVAHIEPDSVVPVPQEPIPPGSSCIDLTSTVGARIYWCILTEFDSRPRIRHISVRLIR
jgi:hypothetical protein